MLSRRGFLATAVSATAAVAGGYPLFVEPHWLEIVSRPLPIRNLPGSLDGKTLVQLSDIHVGSQVADEYVLETFARVAALRPDIVVYTGDFITYHEGIFEQAARIYASGPRGRLATIGSLGNHDYGYQWNDPKTAGQLLEILRATGGMTMLRNAAMDVDGLRIIGLDDVWANQFAPEQVLSQKTKDAPGLVLSHNPDSLDLPVWESYQGWVLSGHTHGGQCRAPFLPPPILPVKNRRYTAGEIAVPGNRRVYISRGVGHLMQVRFAVRPEVTQFTLTRSDA